MTKQFLILICFWATTHLNAASPTTKERWVEIGVEGYTLSGKYLPAKPTAQEDRKAILVIAGSGATDHNGNNTQMGLNNNSYQMLAAALNDAGYAILRTDKRGVGKSLQDGFDMSKTSFNRYVQDVVSWLEYLQQEHDEITVIGHSLGGLMSMQAAQKTQVNKLIALASVADSGYATIKRQMGDQPEFVSQAAIPLLDRLAKNETIPAEDVPPFLNALFNPKLQPYMRSFMMLEPREELAELSIPVLVLVGDNDVQITVAESERLAADLAHAELKVIKGMNHVLKQAPADRSGNIATYANPDLPLHPELIPTILAFLQAKNP